MKVKPKKGKGERSLDCPHYESCLDFAAIQNWKSFNCESCGFYVDSLKKARSSPEKKENTKICNKCGKNPTIQPNSPLCASCIGKQAWMDGKAKKKVPASPKRKETTQNKAIPEKPHQDLNTALTIKFGKYASVLSEVEKIAEEEVRSVDLQVIYILKKYLKNVHVT